MQRRLWLQTAITAGVSSAAAASLLTLQSCGFQLRGLRSTSGNYVFKSLFSGFAPTSPIGVELKRSLQQQGVTVLDTAADAARAEVVLRVIQEQRERAIVGTGVSGQVNAVQLRLRLQFSLFTPTGKALLEGIELLQQREQSYSESAALAKEAEETLLYRDMQQEIAQQLMRRLAALRSL